MLRRSRNIEGLLASRLGGGEKEKDFDWSQLNPMEWGLLGGDREMNIPKTYQNIKDYFSSDDEDMSLVRDYTQAGGDAGGLEEMYKQIPLEEIDQLSIAPPPRQSEDIPGFVSSQMEQPLAQQAEHGLDIEARRLKAEREFTPALASLGYQEDPSLWDKAKTIAMGLFSPDEEAQAEQFEQQYGRADRHPSMPQQSLLSVVPGMEDYDDDMGNILNEELGPDKIDVESGFGDRLSQGRIGDAFSGLFASDDEDGKKKKKMSKEAMKVGANLLKSYLQEPSGSQQRQMPKSSITRGSVPFAGLLSQKPQRQKTPYFVPKGLV